MSDQSAILTRFIAITGAEADVAKQYLQASNWEFSAAVDRFYTNPPVSEDNQLPQQQEPEVRAPIQATYDRLVGPEPPVNPLGQLLSNFMQPMQMQPRSRDWAAQWDPNGISSSSSRRQPLGELFQAPPYKFNGTLQDACSKAERENKAVIVNIQSVERFESHTLNRDVWKDNIIMQIIEHNFILCQWDTDHPEGQKYIQFYNCYNYPHLSILNPIIRKEVLVFSDKRTQSEVQEVLLGWLEKKPSKKRSLPDSSWEDRNSRRTNSTDTEEKLLEAAIQKSLEEYKEDIPSDEKMSKVDEKTSLAKKKIQAETALPPLPVEPPLSDKTTNLRVQLPNGRKLVRRFSLDSKARLIFNWCANEFKSREINLMTRFPKKVLGEEDYDKTLSELQFRNIQLFLTSSGKNN